MSKKVESISFKVARVIVILFIISGLYFVISGNVKNKEVVDENSINKNNINKNNKTEKININGTFIVKDDKNSKLIINDNGEYELFINSCQGYLKVTGKYSIIENKLRLINKEEYKEYPTINENKEFSLTIIDEETIKLDEELLCLFQGTLFEK